MAYSTGSPFGRAPGQISAPPSIYDQLNQNIPNYAALTASASGDVGNELAGRLSPEAISLIQNKSASMGVAGGMPGSGFSNNNFLTSLGLTSEDLMRHGLTDYGSFSGTVAGEQQNPALLNEINTQNAFDAAAPDPAASQSYAEQLFNKYMNQSSGKKGFLESAPYGGNYVTDKYGQNHPQEYAYAGA